MRLFLSGAAFFLLILGSTAAAETALQPDLTGSWMFTWDNDDKNTNPVTLKHEAGTITGIYINDSKEKCPMVGRLGSAASLILVIMCPGWDIKSEGSIASPGLVTGKYLAYGDSAGEFRLSRN